MPEIVFHLQRFFPRAGGAKVKAVEMPPAAGEDVGAISGGFGVVVAIRRRKATSGAELQRVFPADVLGFADSTADAQLVIRGCRTHLYLGGKLVDEGWNSERQR